MSAESASQSISTVAVGANTGTPTTPASALCEDDSGSMVNSPETAVVVSDRVKFCGWTSESTSDAATSSRCFTV